MILLAHVLFFPQIFCFHLWFILLFFVFLSSLFFILIINIFWCTFNYAGRWVIENFHPVNFRKQDYFFLVSSKSFSWLSSSKSNPENVHKDSPYKRSSGFWLKIIQFRQNRNPVVSVISVIFSLVTFFFFFTNIKILICYIPGCLVFSCSVRLLVCYVFDSENWQILPFSGLRSMVMLSILWFDFKFIFSKEWYNFSF